MKNKGIWWWSALILFIVTASIPVLFFMYHPDNLMHSDMSAEVILAKLLAGEKRLLSPNWYYSTEIRIIYTHLVMTPLFMLFPAAGMHMIKFASIIVYVTLLAVIYILVSRSFGAKGTACLLPAAMLLTPLSNEYFDMVLIGCFYTSQLIVTFLIIAFFMGKEPEKTGRRAVRLTVLFVSAFILGLSGLRYGASLYAPLFVACLISFVFEKDEKKTDDIKIKTGISFAMGIFCAIGCAVNMFVFPKFYHFDRTGSVKFVAVNEIPGRFVTSVKLMAQLMGFKTAPVFSLLGVTDIIKIAMLCYIVYVTVWLSVKRYKVLSGTQRLILYYFLTSFFINWFMLVFTDVLTQYRYWIPSLSFAILLIGVYLSVRTGEKENSINSKNVIAVVMVVITVISSFYGELYFDIKNNDCAKRYGYMEFLEKNGYDFGYATFWNASVTEYLSDGRIHVGNLGGDENGSAPYEWLTPTYYYRKGYHEGKTFLLLARTEEPALESGDITFMQNAPKVYEDDFYVIYEGEGMYLFSNP